MASGTDTAWMARALRLAQRGLYTTDPNPRVGCVVVRDGRVVGEGFHARVGEPHAEVAALGMAGEAAAGATVYVTLEPCCHHGRTPPCTDALIDAGVARVVYALRDPNPRVSGAGAGCLAEAGVTVERLDASAPDARALNIGFVKRMATGRPWIRIKMAMSLDGRTALASGESRWITGADARTDVHRWRARASCILTGRGTVAADDPALTVRLPEDEAPSAMRSPWVAIVDSGLTVPPTARLFDLHERVVIFTRSAETASAAALQARGAEIVPLPGDRDDHGVDPAALFSELGRREVNEVHVEAGPTLCGRLLETGYVDELIVYMAPQVLGDSARGLFAMTPLASMAERTRLHLREVRHVGGDLRIHALPLIDRE